MLNFLYVLGQSQLSLLAMDFYCHLTNYHKLGNWKKHSFLVSQFLQVRSLGTAEWGSPLRVSPDWQEGASRADSFLELGSSFQLTELLAEFRCLPLEGWGPALFWLLGGDCCQHPEAHAAPCHVVSPHALSHFEPSHQKHPVPFRAHLILSGPTWG